MYEIMPELSINMLFNNYIDPSIYYPNEVVELLNKEGYTSLGWLNDNIIPPVYNDWERVYKNRSGSYTIMASPENLQYYCVDMGD